MRRFRRRGILTRLLSRPFTTSASASKTRTESRRKPSPTTESREVGGKNIGVAWGVALRATQPPDELMAFDSDRSARAILDGLGSHPKQAEPSEVVHTPGISAFDERRSSLSDGLEEAAAR